MAFAMRFAVDVKHAMARLNGLKLGRKNAIIRTATTKASRLVAKTAKAKLSGRRKQQTKDGIKRTGQLQKSIGIKVWTKGETVMGIIGPRKGFRIQVGTRKKDGKKGKAGTAIYHDPALVSHLVELGHSGPKPAPAYPYMRPGYEESRTAVQQIFADEVNNGIAKLAAKGQL